jgi:menaquinone-specific isochorismate synthase
VNFPVTIFTDNNISAAKRSLRKRLHQLFSSKWLLSNHESSRRIVRLEEPVSGCTPLQWLQLQSHPVKVYWSDRKHDFESAGIGFSDVVKSDDEEQHNLKLLGIKQKLGDVSGKAKYYGGMRFNSKTEIDEHWLPYGSCLFILPQFELYSDVSGTHLACNIIIEPGQQPFGKLQYILESLDKVQIDEETTAMQEGIAQFTRKDTPEKKQWFCIIDSVLDILKSGKAEKIVLGRSTLLLFDVVIKSVQLMERLKRIEPVAYHFYIQPEEGNAFIGASPECLYKRHGSFIQSEAVAGTCPRGMTLEDDRRLGEALLQSEKNHREHICVRNNLKSLLENCCQSLQIEDIKLLKQAKVQHLYSYVYGQLAESISDMDLLKLLHPTPAVGGLPRDRALQDIDKLEPFDRGWYAGPVGWIGHDMAEFAVGIRSALITGSTLRLFAGAGVVEGSKAQLEWDEMESKISAFMNALGKD